MANMMILNPRKRGARRKAPSAAQLAARKKFAALARARAKAKRNPSKRKKRAAKKARARVSVVNINPSPLAMFKRKRKSSRRRSPVRAWSRKARRNPILPRSFMDTHLQPAMVGAAGAVLNDVAVGKLVSKLPASLQKAEIRHLVKGVTAIGLSMLAAKGKVASNSTIRAATVGALTCVLHDAARAQVQKALPTVALGEYLSEVIGPWNGAYSYSGGLNEYLSGGADQIGAYDQAPAEYVS